MPTSVDSFDQLSSEFLQQLQPKVVLDIGCGAGKYAKKIKSICPAASIDGIEIEASYVTKYALNTLYDRLFIGDATRIMAQSEATYDLAILGDCIEHMPKSQGIDLLNVLIHQCAYILIIAPYALRQDAIDGVGAERHRSVWTERDFDFHDYWAWTAISCMQWFLIRGYVDSPVPLHAVVRHINEKNVPIKNPFRDTAFEKPANLQTVDHRKIEAIDGVKWLFRPE